MTPQNQLAFILTLKPGNKVKGDLLQDLTVVAENPADNQVFSFGTSPTAHFARWVIIPGREEGSHFLVFSSNYDGTSRKQHLEEWMEVNETGFDNLLKYCEGYNPSDSQKDKVRFLHKKLKNPAAFYIGTRGHSIRDIHRDFKLRDFIRDFLDTKKYQEGEEKQIVRDIKEAVKQNGKFDWAFKKSKYPLKYRIFKTFQKAWDYGRLGLLGLVFLAGALTAGFLLLLFLAWVLTYFTGWLDGIVYPILAFAKANLFWTILLILLALFVCYVLIKLRSLENTEGQDHTRISLERTESLSQVEDLQLQNQMTHLVTIKQGRFREATSRLALWGIYVLAKHLFNKGTLGGIPSIHFARWIIVDKRFLFFSNFDASWTNYLGDFIDKASLGLTGAWSSTLGFPKTRFLAFGGATMAQRFKRWARNLQIPTQVWYAAYPNLSVENINNNAKIRQGLSGDLSTAKKRKEWLARF